MRRSSECEGCDEELYIKDKLVVWSRGTLDGAGQAIKSFTMNTLVEDVRFTIHSRVGGGDLAELVRAWGM